MTCNYLQNLEMTLADLQGQLDDVTTSRDKLEKIKDNQVAEIKRLRVVEGHNADLIAEVKEVNQRNKELTFRLSRATRELNESTKQEQEAQLDALRAKLAKLLKEKEEWTRKDEDYRKQINDLLEENNKLRHALADSERMRSEMHSHLEEASQEIMALKRHSANFEKGNFRDFISMKRELMTLREENDQLKIQLKVLLPSQNDKRIELPRLNNEQKSGRKSRIKILKD